MWRIGVSEYEKVKDYQQAAFQETITFVTVKKKLSNIQECLSTPSHILLAMRLVMDKLSLWYHKHICMLTEAVYLLFFAVADMVTKYLHGAILE